MNSTNIILEKFSPGSPANQETVAGEAWDTWIAILHLIFTKAGLPAENRQDGEGASPFVRFVDEVQLQLPKPLKDLVRKRSADALSKAIYRATTQDRFKFFRDEMPDDLLTEISSVELLVELNLGIVRKVFKNGELTFRYPANRIQRINEILAAADRDC